MLGPGVRGVNVGDTLWEILCRHYLTVESQRPERLKPYEFGSATARLDSLRKNAKSVSSGAEAD